ncbi:hypothetical protein ANN_16144 [Periplaneta americana]|uniref:DUF4817 domain-containing protein n=1 Tax=Periplaneta americana TaxID=6978 RepID=A0ABQ8SJD7_PERAM|nr:hypothetical protein ANN_16144 [Periplaneta americana]
MAPVRHRWSINDVIGGIRNTVMSSDCSPLFSTFCVNVKMQYTLNQRLFLVKQYWITNSITATQRAYQREFGVRNPPKRNTILGLINKLETTGSLDSQTEGFHTVKVFAAGACRVDVCLNIESVELILLSCGKICIRVGNFRVCTSIWGYQCITTFLADDCRSFTFQNLRMYTVIYCNRGELNFIRICTIYV